MLHKDSRSGLTASAVTVAYAFNALELVSFVGVELQLSAWYEVCCTLPFGLLGPMLQSHPPRDKEGDLMGLVPVARNTLLIDHIRSGIRLDAARRLRSSTYVTVEHADDFVQVARGELLEKVLAQTVCSSLGSLRHYHPIRIDVRNSSSALLSCRASPYFGALYAA
jgi:hypothetical protein